MSAVLSARDLSKRYRRTTVLEGLTLDVPEGSVFGFLGPNGAGKTTTIKILMNVIRPSGGRAEILGVDSRHLGPSEFERIGYVSENQEMPEWMTVDSFLSYLKPFYPSWDSARADELARQFQLPRHRRIDQLSRGMRMKTMLASSLAYRPRLIVLDEPFSGLDPMVREDLVQGLIESAEETTILISSHDLADIETFASHIGYLEQGRLLLSEEMTSLAARFREIEVALEPSVLVPGGPPWPQHWLRPETTPALVRFVESRFEDERTRGEIRRVLGEALHISVNPMSLRDIFVTLARSAESPA